MVMPLVTIACSWYAHSPTPGTTFYLKGTTPFSFPAQGTYASNLNPASVVTGEYLDANGVSHGYVRAHNGAITTFRQRCESGLPADSKLAPCGLRRLSKAHREFGQVGKKERGAR